MDNYFDGNLIESCDMVNGIGVDINLAQHFGKHIDRIIATAYSRIHLIFRCFVSRNLHALRSGKRILLI